MAGGSASALSLSRPAQALLTLRPIGLLSRPRRPLSRGSSPAGCPPKPLASFRTHRQLSGWNPPPLMIRAFGAHCQFRSFKHATVPPTGCVPASRLPFWEPRTSCLDREIVGSHRVELGPWRRDLRSKRRCGSAVDGSSRTPWPSGATWRHPNQGLFVTCPNRQACDRPEAGPLPPSDLRVRHSQLELRPASEQCLQRALAFDTRELVAKAKMDARAKGEMAVRPPLEIEPFGMLIWHPGPCWSPPAWP